MSFTLHGLGVSGGIAIGRAMLMSHATIEVSHLTVAPRMVDKEVARLEAAIKAVKAELVAMKETTEHAPAELAAFIDIHTMFLDDPELVVKPCEIIRERRCNAEWALVQQMEHLVDQFEQFDDPYLRERKFDVVQVVERVVKELLGHRGRTALKTARRPKEEALIVVAHDLSPADTIAFKEHRFAAFITDVGGATSHTAILARGMGIHCDHVIRNGHDHRDALAEGDLACTSHACCCGVDADGDGSHTKLGGKSDLIDIPGSRTCCRDVAGDHHKRRAIHGRFGQCGERVGETGAIGDAGHGDVTGCAIVRVGSSDGGGFMANGNELTPAANNLVEKVGIAVSHQTERHAAAFEHSSSNQL